MYLHIGINDVGRRSRESLDRWYNSSVQQSQNETVNFEYFIVTASTAPTSASARFKNVKPRLRRGHYSISVGQTSG